MKAIVFFKKSKGNNKGTEEKRPNYTKGKETRKSHRTPTLSG